MLSVVELETINIGNEVETNTNRTLGTTTTHSTRHSTYEQIATISPKPIYYLIQIINRTTITNTTRTLKTNSFNTKTI